VARSGCGASGRDRPYGAARIRKLRGTMGLSQAVFADALNVSRETVRAWEQGKREPEGATLRLLEVAERHPQVILDAVAPKERDSDSIG
jgi:putative transcriptional regulator